MLPMEETLSDCPVADHVSERRLQSYPTLGRCPVRRRLPLDSSQLNRRVIMFGYHVHLLNSYLANTCGKDYCRAPETVEVD